MLFVHCADVHLGNIPDSDKPWGKDRAYDIKDSFENVIKKCKELNADLLFISGDLFHRQPLTADLNEVNELFKTIPDTHIMIVTGNKDYLRPNSSIYNFEFADNVHYFLKDYPEEYEIADLNCVIHGFSYTSPEYLSPSANSIDVLNDDKTHILIAHGGDSTHCPIDFNLLTTKNFSYVALGHVHKHEVLLDGHIAYAGSLEPQSQIEVKEHGVYIGEINPMTRRLENLHFEPIAKCSYIPLSIGITEETTEEDLLSSISTEIEKRGTANIYKLRITGERNPDIEFNLDNLSKEYRIIEAIDESEPKYNFVKLSIDHPNDMIGAFIRSFQDKDVKDMSYIEKKAMFYGINALLKTKDK